MPIEILLSPLSPDMEEANISAWHKREGDEIRLGEVIADIETDKATIELEAVDSGILGKILVPAGTENVEVGSVLGLLLAEGETSESLTDYAAGEKATDTAQAVDETGS